MTKTEKKTIFLVDDNKACLAAGKEILKESYALYPIPSAGRMFELLENVMPNLILLDIEMPGMNGYEAIRRLKGDSRWASVPVVFLSSLAGEGDELLGLELGAVDYVNKPFSPPLLRQRIANHLRAEAQRRELEGINQNLDRRLQERGAEIIGLQYALFASISELVECRDGETGGHITRTQRYVEILVRQLSKKGLYQAEAAGWNLGFLLAAVPLHDVGKIGISDLILNKPGRLDAVEFQTMKKHVDIGVDALLRIEKNYSNSQFMAHAVRIIGAHHEKWDGSGYPKGLKGEAIPLEGRLMAIADVYDALVSRRPYKKPLPPEEAEAAIVAGKGSHFDPALVDAFLDAAGEFAEVARNFPGGATMFDACFSDSELH
jgi:putative two-component system response regulator